MHKRYLLVFLILAIFMITQASPGLCEGPTGNGDPAGSVLVTSPVLPTGNDNAGNKGGTSGDPPGSSPLEGQEQPVNNNDSNPNSLDNSNSSGEPQNLQEPEKNTREDKPLDPSQNQAPSLMTAQAVPAATATLRVVTQAKNWGDTKTPADFSVHVTNRNGEEMTGSPQPGSESGTVYSLAPGGYTIKEDCLSGYTCTMSGDVDVNGNVSLDAGDDKTITINNEEVLKVLSTSPTAGAVEVPIGETEIRITFNQPIRCEVPPEYYSKHFQVTGKYDFSGMTCTPVIESADPCTLKLKTTLLEDDTITVRLSPEAVRRDSEPVNSPHIGTVFEFSFDTSADPTTVADIPDPVLKQAIKETLGIPADREIHKNENPNVLIYDNQSNRYVPLKAMNSAGFTEFTYPTLPSQYFGNQIQSIEGLQYAINLEKLMLNWCSISDLTPLNGLSKLNRIEITGCPLGATSLTPLANLPQLSHLALSGCGISDITALQGVSATLQYLYLGGNSISDITVLQGMNNLKELDLSNNSVFSISALGNLTGLTHLSLSNNSIGSFSPISGLSALQVLDLSHTRLEGDISFLSGLNSLRELDLAENFIVNTTPLTGLTLNQLDLAYNCIYDPAPLNGITWVGDSPRINLQFNVDMDESTYNNFCTAMSEKGVSCNGGNIRPVYPSASDPLDQAIGVSGTGNIKIIYSLYLQGQEATDYMKRLKLGNYFSKMKIFVNGLYDEQLTASLLFVESESTPDSLVFSHNTFPNASTITIMAPVRLDWRFINT